MIEALAPHWERVLESRPSLDPETPYYLLPVQDIDPTKNPLDPLAVYILAVQLGVSGDLRCRERGKPSVWVSHAVHASVNGSALDIGVAPQHWLWVGELLVPILSMGSASVVRRINGQPFSDFEETQEKVIESARAGTPFNQWKKLKRLAHEELDQLLDALRDQVESKTADWPNMYDKGRTTRTQDTMQKLVRWVVGREEQYLGDRSATNALLKELRLDPPGKSKNIDKNEENISESP
ncbi:MAG TPA: hypothetical protein VGW38_10270 [Chloroflexota bacterium]|nr:hypothetical protein [Chloroflexota bacterium]